MTTESAHAQLFSSPRTYRLIWAAVAFGLLLRVTEYLECRSLWLDESFLSLNIIQKDLPELFSPLNYEQGAPVGFLIAQKLCVLAFGSSEYALRLFPLFCSALALIAFARLSITTFAPTLALMAVTLFAATDPLIHYAAEAKQYGGDATAAILLLLATLHGTRHEFDFRRTLLLGAAGAVAMFFSHPAIFILAGIGLTLSIECLLKRRWNRVRSLLLLFACWLLGFALCYVINLRHLSGNPFYEEFWRQDFLPSLFDIRWLQRLGVARYLDFLALCPYRFPLYILLVLGMFRVARVNPMLFSFILTSIGFTLIASVLHKYPLFERFLIFIIPSTLILIAAGIAVLADVAARHTPNDGRAIAATVLIFLVAHGVESLWTPRTVQDVKPVLAYIQTHKKPGDLIYVSQLAAYPFKYYAARYGFNSDIHLPESYVDPALGQKYANGLKRRYDRSGFNPIILGYCSCFTTTADNDLVDEVKPVLGAPRVWIFNSHDQGPGLDDIQHRTTKLLDDLGVRLATYERPGLWGGAAVYLYNLSPKPTAGSVP